MSLFDRMKERPVEATSVAQELKRTKMFGIRDLVIWLLVVGFLLL